MDYLKISDYVDAMIEVYVPEADCMSREEAFVLAEERDAQAAEELRLSFEGGESGEG